MSDLNHNNNNEHPDFGSSAIWVLHSKQGSNNQ